MQTGPGKTIVLPGPYFLFCEKEAHASANRSTVR